MSAEWFECSVNADTMKEAFDACVESAAYAYGHSGYTGTIAEKDEFIDFGDWPENVDPSDFYGGGVDREDGLLAAFGNPDLIDKIATTADDKWGPACGFKTVYGGYLFFGWASS